MSQFERNERLRLWTPHYPMRVPSQDECTANSFKQEREVKNPLAMVLIVVKLKFGIHMYKPRLEFARFLFRMEEDLQKSIRLFRCLN